MSSIRGKTASEVMKESGSPDQRIDLRRVIIPGNQLLVRQLSPEAMTAGGLIIPPMAQQERTIAEVVKVGLGVPPWDDYNRLVEWQEGWLVLVGAYALDQVRNVGVELGDPQLHIVRCEDVLAIIKKA